MVISNQSFPSNFWPLAATYLLSITVILPFPEFCGNRSLPSVVFCVWLFYLGIMLIRFIHIAHISAVFYLCIFGYPGFSFLVSQAMGLSVLWTCLPSVCNLRHTWPWAQSVYLCSLSTACTVPASVSVQFAFGWSGLCSIHESARVPRGGQSDSVPSLVSSGSSFLNRAKILPCFLQGRVMW